METFVVSLLHFNVQYCAGGTEGLIVDGTPTSDEAVQDQILVESFEPVLTMLEAHPTWGMNLEIQALGIEIMAERHPEMLARLKALADSGQVELVSFHYSDQLFIAFPWRDQEKSMELTQEVFEEHGLPLSGVVFTQEGQFGEGMLQRMPEFGYSVAILPHNLYEYVTGAEPENGLWKSGDVTVISGGSGSFTDTARLDWHFLNDGELYATGDMNCYLGKNFAFDAEALAKKEASLQASEDAGARITTIGTFVAEHGTEITEPLPPMVDGVWQPADTENVYRWMGGPGLWNATETDDVVRTVNMRARHAIAAAELVPGVDEELIDEAWRMQLLGEVSDATGWNPYTLEVAYGIEHSEAAQQLALDAIEGACAEYGNASYLTVDVATGAVTKNGAIGAQSGGEAAEAPIDVELLGRPGSLGWTTTGTANVTRLTVTLNGGAESPEIVFPWDGLVVSTVPSLGDTLRDIDATTLPDELAIPVASGLLRLSEGVWLVKNTSLTHLAARFHRSEGTVSFKDETGPTDGRTWYYYVVQGTGEEALAFAQSINETPVVTLSCPVEMSADLPCGCNAGAGPTGLAVIAAAGLGAWRRRKGRR